MRRFILPGAFVLLLFITLFNRVPDPASQEDTLISIGGQTMGTTFTVKVRTEVTDEKLKLISDETLKVLQAVVASMSTYEPQSELMRWNDSPSDKPITISSDLATVVAAGLDVHQASEGAFEMTVQPLVELWGFGPSRRTEPPSDNEITKALAATGSRYLNFNVEAGTLTKTKPHISIDLSAIAKGFAVDRVSERLASLGYADHFVEIGGEVRTSGYKGEKKPWRVGIEKPAGGGGVRLSLPLLNRSIATSGSYRNYRELGDKIFSHTIDPRTGRPVTHRLVSVSVIAKRCMYADAWATALAVLGPEKGFEVATRHSLAVAFMFLNDEGELVERRTKTFNLLSKADSLGSNVP
ncbi:MAG: FAD:protein FMN transferase [Bradymonadia bacterium]